MPEPENNKRKTKDRLQLSLLDQGRLPPQAIELEVAVIGACMLERDVLPRIIHMAKPDIFYKEAHQKIFKAIIDLFEGNHPIDILTVTERLKFNGELELVGGPYYVTQLTSRIASSSNIVYHCQIVFQKYLQREIIRICSETTRLAFEDTTDLFEMYDNLIDEIKKLGIDKTNAKEKIIDSVEDTFNVIDSHADVNAKNYYPTRLQSINEILAPSPGNVLMLGAMSKAGKTSLVSEIVFGLHELNPTDISTLWYCMEDPPKHMILGYISREIKLTIKQMLGIGYKMSPEEIKLAKSYQNVLKSYDVEFVGRRTKIKTIKNHFIQFCEKRKEEKKSKMYILVIDNLMKLLDYNEEKSNHNTTAIDDYVASVIGDIFDYTKDYCYVIMLHHFTKEQFNKKNLVDAFRPTMEHFRGSSRLHEVCTQVALLNRPGFFDDLVKEYKDTDYYDTIKNLMILDVTMNRFIGTTGIIRLLGNLNYRTFEDLNYELYNQ